MDKNGHLIDLADSALSGNVRIFGEIDPEWEVDPKSIVFQEKVRAVLGGRGGGGYGLPVGILATTSSQQSHVTSCGIVCRHVKLVSVEW
jgi:hypothetical protein